MDYEEFVSLAHEVRENWGRWDDVSRGEAIIDLRQWVSYSKMGRLVGCSEES